MSDESWGIFWNYTKRYLGICFVFIPLALIPIFLFLDYLPRHRELSFVITLRHSVYYIYLFCVILFCLYTVIRAAVAQSGSLVLHSYTQNGWFHGAVMALMTVIGVTVTEYLQPLVRPQLSTFSKTLPGSFFAVPFVILIIYYFFGRRFYGYKYRELKIVTLEAQYNALKAQLQPHFLFNSLNSLAKLVQIDTESGYEMVLKLSDLYREILENSKSSTSSLASEISIARKYLELEKIRFGDRLSFDLETPSFAGTLFIPSLLLQTLVENAVKHGIAKLAEGGQVCLRVEEAGNGLYRLELVNTGRPFDPRAKRGTGLTNTVERLRLLVGDQHRFSIAPYENKGTIVSFYVGTQAKWTKSKF